MLVITFIGDPLVLFISCLILGTWLLRLKQKSEATTLAIAAIGAIGLNILLKHLFSRARPALWDRIVDVGQYSFPSGHAMVSMVIYGFIGYILANRYRRQQWWIVSLTTLLVIAIGFSRLYLGVHWPTDIIAGYAAGLVWLIACIYSSKIWHTYRAK
jgi:membrane-associated phospholipid phosphatase